MGRGRFTRSRLSKRERGAALQALGRFGNPSPWLGSGRGMCPLEQRRHRAGGTGATGGTLDSVEVFHIQLGT